MKAKVLKSPPYSFRDEVIGHVYEVARVEKRDGNVWLRVHDLSRYPDDKVWRFEISGVEFIDEMALGTKVKLNPKSEWFTPGVKDCANPEGVVGVIVRYDERDLLNGHLGIHVNWENGCGNSYRKGDLIFAHAEKEIPRERKPKVKQKPKRREQTIVYFVFVDGTDYEQRRAKGVVINADHKEIHVQTERDLGKGLVIRENSSVPFALLEAVRVSTPDGEFCYYFTNGELTGSAREFNKNLPFKTQMH